MGVESRPVSGVGFLISPEEILSMCSPLTEEDLEHVSQEGIINWVLEEAYKDYIGHDFKIAGQYNYTGNKDDLKVYLSLNLDWDNYKNIPNQIEILKEDFPSKKIHHFEDIYWC